MTDETRAWAESLAAERNTSFDEDAEGRLIFDAPYFRGQPLRGAPAGTRVVLRGVTGNPYILTIGPDAPESIELVQSGDLQGVEVNGSDLSELALTNPQKLLQTVTLQLRTPVGHLVIRDGASVLVESGEAPGAGIALDNGSIQTHRNWEMARLVLEGTCRITSGIRAEETLVGEKCQLRAVNGPHLGRIRPLTQGSLPSLRLLKSPNPCSATSIDTGGRLQLDEAHITFLPTDMEHPNDMKDLTVSGRGHFVLTGTTVTGVLFEPASTDALVVDIQRRGAVWDARGALSLQASRGAVLAGDPRAPVTITSLQGAEGAELEGFRPYDLRVEDLEPLSTAERVEPWIPRRRSDAEKAEEKMTLGGGPSASVQRKRAHFWQRLSRILAESHATGGTQSAARFAAMVARRRALANGREKTLLTWYSWVGYGERIGRPLGILAGLSLVAALALEADPRADLCCERIGEVTTTWSQLLLSPLAFFRFTVVPDVTGSDFFVVLLTRVFGTLLLFFGLAAARRVVKADT